MISTAKLISRPYPASSPVAEVQNYNSGKLPEFCKGMRLQVKYISPAKAKRILQTHTNFRGLDKRKVEQYAAVMKRGEWGIFPPICIGQSGQLQDGNHRLNAIVLSGKGQWITVVKGVPGSAARHYDNGRPRNPQDILRYDFGSSLRTSARRLQSIIQLTRYGCNNPDKLLNCDYSRLYERYKSAISRFSGIFAKSHRHCPPVLVATFCRAWLQLSGDEVQRDALVEAALKYVRMEFDSVRLGPLRMLCSWICDANLRSRKNRTEAYLRSAKALQAYLSRKAVKRLIPARSDPFPLTGVH